MGNTSCCGWSEFCSKDCCTHGCTHCCSSCMYGLLSLFCCGCCSCDKRQHVVPAPNQQVQIPATAPTPNQQVQIPATALDQKAEKEVKE